MSWYQMSVPQFFANKILRISKLVLVTGFTSSMTKIYENNIGFFIITDPFCIIVGKRILVDLGQGNTLQPGDILTLQPNVIYQSGATSQYADFAAGNIPIYRVLDAVRIVFLCKTTL